MNLMKLVLNVTTISLMLLGCGDKKKEYSGSLGTCSIESKSEPVIKGCGAYSFTTTEKVKDDPTDDLKAALKKKCEETEGAGKAVYDASGKCEAGTTGYCTLTTTQGDVPVTTVLYLSGDAVTSDIAKAVCDGGDPKGTYTAPFAAMPGDMKLKEMSELSDSELDVVSSIPKFK